MSLPLVQLDPGHVTAVNWLLSEANCSMISGHAKPYRWRWRSAKKSASSRLGMRLQAEEMELTCWFVRERISALIPDVEIGQFEGKGKLLALSRRYAWLIEHLGFLTACEWSPVECIEQREFNQVSSETGCIAFHVEEASDTPCFAPVFEAYLEFESLAGQCLCQAAGRRGRRAQAIQDVIFPLRVCLLSVAVPAVEVSRVKRGGALVLSVGLHGAVTGRLIDAGGCFSVSARLIGESLVIKDAATPLPVSQFYQRGTMQMDALTNPCTDTVAGDNKVDLQELPVELSFEIGHVNMTLGQLEAAIHEGYTFNLGQPLSTNSIVIRANGRHLAKGELMKIGELLAVRITET